MSQSNQHPKTVVITGASAGVGRAAAQRFAKDGWRVGLIARGRAGLEGAAEDVRKLGGTPLVLQADVADAAVEAAAEQAERTLGPIDVWVNNAMVSVFSKVEQMQAADYRRVTEVTYLGSVHGTLSALRRMKRHGRGTIVQVSSALAFRSIPLQSAYCAAKHATVGFLDSLRCELLHDKSNIRISAVHMPALNTPQFGWVKSRLPRCGQPVPPIFQPEVAADAIAYAAEYAPRDLDVGLPTMMAITGQKLIPGLIDRYLGRTGLDSQQTQTPRDPHAPDNLYAPLDETEDRGAHGTFDAMAHDVSPGLYLAKHRRAVAAVVGLGVAGLAVGLGQALSGKRRD